MYNESLLQYSKTIRMRFWAYITLVVFLATTFINPTALQAMNVTLAAPLNVSDVIVPQKIANIQDTFKSTKNNSPLIIHIQDAHLNYEAQKNISGILDAVQSQYGVDSIYIEGANGKVNTSLFRAFPFQGKKEEIIDSYVKQGKISGAEEYSIISQKPVDLIGVDHIENYLSNVKTYVESAKVQDSVRSYMNKIESNLLELRHKVLNTNLATLIEQKEAFFKQDANPLEYTRYLIGTCKANGINVSQYKSFSKLSDLEVYQSKIQPEKIMAETRSLIDEKLIGELSDVDTERLAIAELDFQGERLTSFKYYSLLKEFSLKLGVDFRTYTNVNLYYNYQMLVNDIDAELLMKEREVIEKKLRKKFTETKEEKHFLKITEQFGVLKNIINLKAIPEDLAAFRKDIKNLSTESFNELFTVNGYEAIDAKSFSISKTLNVFKKFYRLAESREDSFINETLQNMKAEDKKVAVLLTGGYHTAGITERLQDKNVSYVVVAPRLSELPEQDLYDKIMRSYDKYFGVSEGQRGGTVKELSNINPAINQDAYNEMMPELISVFDGAMREIVAEFKSGKITREQFKYLLSEEASNALTKVLQVNSEGDFDDPDVVFDRVIKNIEMVELWNSLTDGTNVVDVSDKVETFTKEDLLKEIEVVRSVGAAARGPVDGDDSHRADDIAIQINQMVNGIEWSEISGDDISLWLSAVSLLSIDDLNVDMFRDYDYRNTGPEFKPAMAFMFGLVWAKMAIEKAEREGIDNRDVLIARDARDIEPALVDALVAALRYAGLNVINMSHEKANAVTSYSWGVQQYKPLMSIFCTASHVSQPEDVIVRGFKVAMVDRKGGNILSMSTDEIKDKSLSMMKKIVANPALVTDMAAEDRGTYEGVNIDENVIRFNSAVGKAAAAGDSLYELKQSLVSASNPMDVVEQLEAKYAAAKPLNGMKVVIEGSNTPSGFLASRTFESLGADVVSLNEEIKAISGQHNADPSIDSNLEEIKAKIEEVQADFGMAFDLDGDRGAMVVPHRMATSPETRWNVLAPDNLMVELLPALQNQWGYEKSGKKIGVIRDCLGTHGVNDIADETGAECFVTDAGYVFLKALKEQKEPEGYVFPVYGERSGHTWLDVTGEIENPVAVGVLFSLLVRQDKAEQFEGKKEKGNPMSEYYVENTIPYHQSPRFQPPFHPDLLEALSADERNTTGWKYDRENPTNPPSAVVALGKHVAIEQLMDFFTVGKAFQTSIGEIKVRKFGSYQDSEHRGGKNRFADIIFELNGKFAGHLVFRASSNDPSFVASYEAPEFDNDFDEANLRKQVVSGLVIDFLVKNNIALITRDQIDKESVYKKANLAAVEHDYKKFLEGQGVDSAKTDTTVDEKAASQEGVFEEGSYWKVRISELLDAYSVTPDTNVQAIVDELVSILDNDDAVAIYIAAQLSQMSKTSHLLRSLFELVPVYSDTLSYPQRLLASAVRSADTWLRILSGVDGDVDKAYDLIKQSGANLAKAEAGEEGFATTIITADDVAEMPADQVIEIHKLSLEEREALFSELRKVEASDDFAPRSELGVTLGLLLGGTGSRWQNDLNSDNPEDIAYRESVIERAGGLGKYVRNFKAAAPIGNGKVVLVAAAGGAKGLNTGIVYMRSDENVEVAANFLNDVQVAELGVETNATSKNVGWTQPNGICRIASSAKLERFFTRQPEEKDDLIKKGLLDQVEDFSQTRAGQIAFNKDGAPVLGAENHWDYTKYLLKTGAFVKLFKNQMTEGQLRDVFLRVGNQDEFGSAMGEGRASEVSQQTLLAEVQKEDGLYDLIRDLEKVREYMSAEEWSIYVATDKYQDQMRRVVGAIVEGGETQGRNTGGGVTGINMNGYVSVGVVEKANFDTENPPVANVTNTNTSQFSLLGIALAAGILPSMIEKMIIELESVGELSNESKQLINAGVALIEKRALPTRSQVKLKDGTAYVRAERDIHGPWGRAIGAMLVNGESYSTYKAKMRDADIALLRGEMTVEEHRSYEEFLAQNTTFAPGKKFADLKNRERLVKVISRQLGYVSGEEAAPMRTPIAIISESSSAENALQSLIAEGYYFSGDELDIVEAAYVEFQVMNIVLGESQKQTLINSFISWFYAKQLINPAFNSIDAYDMLRLISYYSVGNQYGKKITYSAVESMFKKAQLDEFIVSQDDIVAQASATLKNEDFNGQLDALYGVADKEAAAEISSKMAQIGFDGKSNRLGWGIKNVQAIVNETPEALDQVINDANAIRENFKYVIFCGMGGSGLSVQMIKDTFGEKDTKIYSLRTTDPGTIKSILDEIEAEEGSLKAALENTLVIPISKSGTTAETVSHKDYFTELYVSQGLDVANNMWVVTDSGSPFDTGDFEQRNIQLNEKGDIGGRFTAPTTNIFLMPLAIVAPELVWDIMKKAEQMNNMTDIEKDQFIQLAIFLYANARQGKDKVTFIIPKELRQLPLWAEQLFEESLGKDGKGISLFYAEDLTPEKIRSLEENDRVFVRIGLCDKKGNKELWDFVTGNGYDTFDISLDSLADIGGLNLGFERTVAAFAYLWDICFVDQPAVEGYKRETRKVMAEFEERKQDDPNAQVEVPSDWKSAKTDSVEVFYTPLLDAYAIKEDVLKATVEKDLGASMDNAAAVYAAVIKLIASRTNVEAIELMNYGLTQPEMQEALSQFRDEVFTTHYKKASKLGEGPDKNHSFHQNIEGGKDMWFSTYFMPTKFAQRAELKYGDNLIKAQTIGTVNALSGVGRKVALVAYDPENIQEFTDFLGTVQDYLLHGLPTTQEITTSSYVLKKIQSYVKAATMKAPNVVDWDGVRDIVLSLLEAYNTNIEEAPYVAESILKGLQEGTDFVSLYEKPQDAPTAAWVLDYDSATKMTDADVNEFKANFRISPYENVVICVDRDAAVSEDDIQVVVDQLGIAKEVVVVNQVSYPENFEIENFAFLGDVVEQYDSLNVYFDYDSKAPTKFQAAISVASDAVISNKVRVLSGGIKEAIEFGESLATVRELFTAEGIRADISQVEFTDEAKKKLGFFLANNPAVAEMMLQGVFAVNKISELIKSKVEAVLRLRVISTFA